MKDFRHKAQDLRVFLRKLIQLREVPRPLRRPRWAYAAGLRECKVGAGGEIPGRTIELGRLRKERRRRSRRAREIASHNQIESPVKFLPASPPRSFLAHKSD